MASIDEWVSYFRRECSEDEDDYYLNTIEILAYYDAIAAYERYHAALLRCQNEPNNRALNRWMHATHKIYYRAKKRVGILGDFVLRQPIQNLKIESEAAWWYATHKW